MVATTLTLGFQNVEFRHQWKMSQWQHPDNDASFSLVPTQVDSTQFCSFSITIGYHISKAALKSPDIICIKCKRKHSPHLTFSRVCPPNVCYGQSAAISLVVGFQNSGFEFCERVHSCGSSSDVTLWLISGLHSVYVTFSTCSDPWLSRY